MSLKIGQVSKLLNLSVETIRYYEQENIINPNRKKDSKFREYDVWDIFGLAECLSYRQRKFSIKEVRDLMKEVDLEKANAKLKEKCFQIKKEIDYNQLLLDDMENQTRKLEAASYNIGNYWCCIEPEKKYLITNIRQGGYYTDFDCNDPMLVTWFKNLPFVKVFMHINKEDFYKQNDIDFWSFTVDSKYMSLLDLPENNNIKVLPSQLYLHTIIDAGEKGEFSIKKLEPSLQYIEDKKYIVLGDILGELLIRVHENGKWHRYIELMIPIIRS